MRIHILDHSASVEEKGGALRQDKKDTGMSRSRCMFKSARARRTSAERDGVAGATGGREWIMAVFFPAWVGVSKIRAIAVRR